MKKLLLSSIGLAMLAGPAFAVSGPTLITGPSSTSATVSTTVLPGCAISGGTTTIAVTIPLNGGAVTPVSAPGSQVTVTCNTPAGVVSVGSTKMSNPALIDPTETATFTNEIDFAGYVANAVTGDGGWRLASRAVNSKGAWQSARIDANEANKRIQVLDLKAIDFETVGKLPVAGAYTGQICVSVNPTGVPLNNVGNATCSAGAVTPGT